MERFRWHGAPNSIFVFPARLRPWKSVPGGKRRTTHSGAPHLLDSSLRCPRWIRQRVLDGRTVSRALARKHAARVSSTFVPRVVSNVRLLALARISRITRAKSKKKNLFFTVRSSRKKNVNFLKLTEDRNLTFVPRLPRGFPRHKPREQARASGPSGAWVSVNNRHSFVLSRSHRFFFLHRKISLRSNVLRSSDLSFTRVHFTFPRKDRPSHRRTAFPRRGYYASGIVSLLHNECRAVGAMRIFPVHGRGYPGVR